MTTAVYYSKSKYTNEESKCILDYVRNSQYNNTFNYRDLIMF